MDKKLNGKFLIDLPPAKNYSSRKDWEAACWPKILKSEKLLDMLITPDEKHDLIMRVAAMDGIFSGKKYRQIGEELWLSPQTISSIKKSLMGKNYQSYNKLNRVGQKKRAYSPWPKNSTKRSRPEGIPRRTKYGTIYIPR